MFLESLYDNKNYKLDPKDYRRRPSIVAHSFGSYIVGRALRKYEHLRLDKIILCGSILPVDFDWPLLFRRDQVNYLRNERGLRDFWVKNVSRVIPETGASGSTGFDTFSTLIEEDPFQDFRHSDFFTPKHMEDYWIPFLERKPSTFSILHGSSYDKTENSSQLSTKHTRSTRCASATCPISRNRISPGVLAVSGSLSILIFILFCLSASTMR
jgi:hypothetical protein